MPQASTIGLFDGLPTPVTRNFVPLSVDTKKAVFQYVPAGEVTNMGGRRLTASLSPPTSTRPTYRLGVRLDYPVTYVDTSVTPNTTHLQHTARASLEVVIPDEMISADRDDFHAFVSYALFNADITGMFTDLESIWG